MNFIISDHEYIKIHMHNLVAKSDPCNNCVEFNMEYINSKNNISIVFGNRQADGFCYFLTEYEEIQKLLSNKKQLSTSIINDLGFEWNEFFKGNSKSNEAFNYHWASNDHKQIRPYYNSWLYNDKNGNIIFEITPFYPWHYATKKTNPEKISYKEWIKNYKPVVTTIIPKENFKEWIRQTQELAKMYKLNL